MFGHFAFGSQSQSFRADLDGGAPSPRDTSHGFHPASMSPPPMIAQQQLPLDHRASFQPSFQPLEGDEMRLFQRSLPIIPAGDEVQEDQDEEMDLTALPPHPPVDELGSSRVERRVKMRLKRRKAQVRDLNALVEEMAISNSQCTRPLPPPQPPPNTSDHIEDPAGVLELVADTRDGHMLRASPEDEDEFPELEEWAMEQGVMLKRACTPSGIRKFGVLRFKTAETVGNQATKVRSIPRMRKRRPPRNRT